MKRIVFFGDSLLAGYGLANPSIDSIPALIQEKINLNNLSYQVINAGVSGNTSGDGLSRIESILSFQIDVFVLELGANDVLRGLSPVWTKNNLQVIIDTIRKKNSQVGILILGMQLPSWIPGQNAANFRKIYHEIAIENHIALVPFFLDGVAGIKHLNMADGIHPLAAGYKIIAENIWPYVLKLMAPAD